ncbi:MAG: MCE family protein [Actinophytocola sp.]|nr:MCE family protein [Actinophytocola sp.]
MKRSGPKPPPSKLALATRGAVACLLVIAVMVYITIASTGAFSGYPEITASVPASNVGISEQAPVEYQGVVVGKVIRVETRETTANVTMRIYDRQADAISERSQVRVLPRTLFGDQYVQLIPPPDGEAGEPISDGDTLMPDTSTKTVQLYEAYVRLTELLDRIEPEQIATALHAMAQLLDGRGEKFGRMIDQLYELTGDVPDLLDLVDDGATTTATLSDQLAKAAPHGIKAMRDAIALSELVVSEQDTLAGALTGGIALSDESTRFLADNTDRFIELLHASGPVVDALARHPRGVPDSVRNARTLLEAGIPTFQTGPWFRIRANLTSKEPYPYTREDCPRYGSQEGQNCPSGSQRTSYGGTAGPVGSEQETRTLTELLRAAPGGQGEQADGMVGVLLGPLVRGKAVVVP